MWLGGHQSGSALKVLVTPECMRVTIVYKPVLRRAGTVCCSSSVLTIQGKACFAGTWCIFAGWLNVRGLGNLCPLWDLQFQHSSVVTAVCYVLGTKLACPQSVSVDSDGFAMLLSHSFLITPWERMQMGDGLSQWGRMKP